MEENNIRTLVPHQPQFDNQQLEIIRKTVAIGLKPEQFLLFIEVCKHYRLNPMARQIYAYDNKGRMVVQTSIDGFRLMAERTGLYGGQIGPEWCGLDGVWKDVWLEKEPPAAARVGIIRRDFDKPIWGVARYTSYAGTTPIWSKAPDVMLAKCSESLAFRKAFPAEMSGIYTHEEMDQAQNEVMPATTVTMEQTEEDKKKARLNSLFKSGKDKGLFLSKEEMAEYITDVLKADIAPDDIPSLMDEEIMLIEGKVASAAEMSVEAQSA
jgi:phage recombination protein Bet